MWLLACCGGDDSVTSQMSQTGEPSPSSSTTAQSDPSEASTQPTVESSSSTTATSATSPPTSPATDTTPEDLPGWLEMGWGLSEFNAFSNREVPIILGPQGLDMFSIALRGGEFLVPDDPSDFDHPDIPVMDMWIDVEGFNGDDDHFILYSDHPIPFAPSGRSDAEVEFVAVWLVLPGEVLGGDLYGLSAHLHVELRCGDGEVVTDDRELTIVEGPKQF